MKRLAVLAAAVCLAIPATATAAASWSAGDVGVKTVAKAAANEMRVGQRISAPRFAKKVRSYQWLRCGVKGKSCAKIAGATHRTYTIRKADVGHVLRVRETTAGGVVALSQPTGVVGLPAPVNTGAPTITDSGPGTLASPLVGDVLTGSNGTWTNAATFTYQWLDCDSTGANCSAIAGATSQTYTVQSSDAGDTIVFQVTATN